MIKLQVSIITEFSDVQLQVSSKPVPCVWDGAEGGTATAKGHGHKLTKCRMHFLTRSSFGGIKLYVSTLCFLKHDDIRIYECVFNEDNLITSTGSFSVS